MKQYYYYYIHLRCESSLSLTCLRSIRTNLGYLSSCELADFEKAVVTNHTKLIKDGSLQVSEGVDLTINDLTHIKQVQN